MRKQTKLVAVASAAALLAIGASMTSFAATGWVEEDGVWYYYDKDGNKVEDEWKKSGDNWYWLDSEEGGAMAVDKLVEDDDDTYYVDANGVMVKNTWVKVVNEDQDDEEDPAEYNYYYMQSSGKAYKNTSSEAKFKTIDGKRYAFDEDGKMLYGWVNEDGVRETDESGWENARYYLGSWEDGAMKTGWQKINVYDEEDDDDVDHWFYFKSNGKSRKAEDGKKINGKRYTFDERGVMVYEWVLASGANGASAADWKYYNSPEDGARATKGWFKVIAPDEDNSFVDYDATFAATHADDESEKWYYADGEGELVVGKIKKISGKYYGFRPDDGAKGAAMLNGLCLLVTDGEDIVKVLEEDMDADTLDEIVDGDYEDMVDGATLFYFGNNADEDGAMKTGSVNITLDGENYSFLFSKSGGAENKGRGMTGIDDEKYIYNYGCRIKASSDDKYKVVEVTPNADGANDINANGVKVAKISSSELRKDATDSYENNDEETVKYTVLEGNDYFLVNTSGAIQKNKTAAKDGDDWYFYVDERDVKLYTNNKTLKTEDGKISKWEDIVNAE